MAKYQEDMIFKDIAEEDVDILLEIVNKPSKFKRIWTSELRQIDPSTYKPDLIIELDNENLIIEFQSTKVDNNFSRRAHSYVAITDQKKKNNKEVNLCVISTVEKTKTIKYKVNKLNIFKYEVFGNDFFDGEKIIKSIEEKYKQKQEITQKESIYYSLAPIMTKNKNIENNLEKTIKIILTLNNLSTSTKNLCYGILWLLVDKYCKDTLTRNLLSNVLGDKMKLIYEYGERKEQEGMQKGMQEGRQEGMQQGMQEGMQKGMRSILVKLYESGMSIKEIAEKTELDIKQVEEILS